MVGTLTLVAALGCNPLTLPFFLTHPVPKIHAEFPLEPIEETEQPPRVLVLTSAHPNLPADFIGSERTLASLLIRQLNQGAKQNRQEIDVVATSEVKNYQREHPHWQDHHPIDIAEEFAADYVIWIAINDMSMYMPKSRHFYQGQVSISLEAYNVHDEIREPAYIFEYVREYPKERPIDVHEMPASKFRLNFLKRIATDLSWKFVPHRVADDFVIE